MSVSTSVGAGNYDVCGLSNGNYAITYQDNTANRDTFFKVVNASGSDVVAATQLNSGTCDTSPPRCCALVTNGGFAVVWVEYDASVETAFYAVYENDGTVRKAKTSVSENNYRTIVPTVSSRATDDAFIVGFGDLRYLPQNDVYMRVFDKDGVAITGEARANPDDPGGARNVLFNHPLLLDDGNVVSTYTNQSADYYFHLFTLSGSSLTKNGTRTMVNSSANDPEYLNESVAIPGGFICLWWSRDDGSVSNDVFARAYDNDGNVTSEITRVNETVSGATDVESWIVGTLLLDKTTLVTSFNDTISVGSSYYRPAVNYVGAASPGADGQELPLSATETYMIDLTNGTLMYPRLATRHGPGNAMDWAGVYTDTATAALYFVAYTYTALSIPTTLALSDFTASPTVAATDDPVISGITSVADKQSTTFGISNGGFVVLYESNASGSYYAYAQRFDAAGAKVGSATQLNEAGKPTRNLGEVTLTHGCALASRGGYVAVWEQIDAGTGTTTYMYYAVFENDGTVRKAPAKVLSAATGNASRQSFSPTVSSCGGSDNFAICCAVTNGSNEMWARVFDRDGTPYHDDWAVSSVGSGDNWQGAACFLCNGDLAVAWSHGASGRTYYQIRTSVTGASEPTLVRGSTNTSGTPFTLDQAARNCSGNMQAVAHGDEWFVVFRDNPEKAYIRKVANDGLSMSALIEIYGTGGVGAGTNQHARSITLLNDSTIAIAYVEETSAGSNVYRPAVRTVNPFTLDMSAAALASTSVTSNVSFALVASLGHNFAVVWDSSVNGTLSVRLYGNNTLQTWAAPAGDALTVAASTAAGATPAAVAHMPARAGEAYAAAHQGSTVLLSLARSASNDLTTSGTTTLSNTGNERNPALTPLSDGKVVVAYFNTSDSLVYVAAADAADAAWGVPTKVFNDGASDLGTPDLSGSPGTYAVCDTSAGFAVAWVGHKTNGTNTPRHVYLKFFGSTSLGAGDKLAPVTGTNVAVSDASNTDKAVSSVSLYSLAGGNLVVAWTVESSAGGDLDIYARVFDTSGAAQTDATLLSSQSGSCSNVHVVGEWDTGGFLAVWTREAGGVGTGFEAVYGGRFAVSGGAIALAEGTSVIDVETSKTRARLGGSGKPLTVYRDNSFVVVFEYAVTTWWDVRAARFKADNTAIDAFDVTSSAGDSVDASVAVAIDTDVSTAETDSLVVMWRNAGDGNALVAQPFEWEGVGGDTDVGPSGAASLAPESGAVWNTGGGGGGDPYVNPMASPGLWFKLRRGPAHVLWHAVGYLDSGEPLSLTATAVGWTPHLRVKNGYLDREYFSELRGPVLQMLDTAPWYFRYVAMAARTREGALVSLAVVDAERGKCVSSLNLAQLLATGGPDAVQAAASRQALPLGAVDECHAPLFTIETHRQAPGDGRRRIGHTSGAGESETVITISAEAGKDWGGRTRLRVGRTPQSALFRTWVEVLPSRRLQAMNTARGLLMTPMNVPLTEGLVHRVSGVAKDAKELSVASYRRV